MQRPDPDRPPDSRYRRSYAELGIIAQRGRLVEVRTPDPDVVGDDWPRIYLTPKAAATLLEWLPQALEVACPKMADEVV